MRACTSTSDGTARARRLSFPALVTLLLATSLLSPLSAPPSFADEPPPESPKLNEEEDYSRTPFMDYAEFNSEKDEEDDTRFFQYGRFFGISGGLGLQSSFGNRGQLWQGGFPTLDFKLIYWFDFDLSLDLELFSSPSFFEGGSQAGGHTDVNLTSLGMNLRYAINTKDLSAAITFLNPYLSIGVGSYTKTQVSTLLQTTDTDSSLGLSAGLGLEFALKPRKVYLNLEPKLHLVRFKDTYTQQFASAPYELEDLTGAFWTFTTNLTFTW
jgi:Outer membrane protein beta-barrel domain